MTLLLIHKIAQLFLILLLGFIIVKAKVLKSEDSMVLSRLSLYLIMPCMILNAFQVELTEEIKLGLSMAVVVSVGIHILLIVIGKLCQRFFHADAVEVGSIVYSNAGNLVIPLVTAILGPEWVIYSCAFLSVQLIFMWTHGVRLFASDAGLNLKKILLNPNMVAIFAGLVMLVLGIKLPSVIGEAVSSVGAMIGPVSMLVAGMLTANMEFKRMFLNKRIYFVLAFRMLICPAVMLLFIKAAGAAAVFPNSSQVLLITFLATMTPAASTIMQFAQIHHKGAEYASAINILTTLSCIVTMPLFVSLYQIMG